MWDQSLDWEDPLEEEMATHSSGVTWEIPWAEESGGLQSMASQSWTWLSSWAAAAGPLATELPSVPFPMGGPFHVKYKNVFTDFMDNEILDLFKLKQNPKQAPLKLRSFQACYKGQNNSLKTKWRRLGPRFWEIASIITDLFYKDEVEMNDLKIAWD